MRARQLRKECPIVLTLLRVAHSDLGRGMISIPSSQLAHGGYCASRVAKSFASRIGVSLKTHDYRDPVDLGVHL